VVLNKYLKIEKILLKFFFAIARDDNLRSYRCCGFIHTHLCVRAHLTHDSLTKAKQFLV